MLKFSGLFEARSHQIQRSGIQPSSLPTLNECDDIIQQQHKVLDAMTRIREVIINQQHALAEQRTRDEANKDSSEYGDDGPLGQDKSEGSGGFAGADPKKRRGVRSNAPFVSSLLTKHSGMPPQGDVIVVTGQRRLNGGEVPMVLEHCAMLADCVRFSRRHLYLNCFADNLQITPN